MPYFRELPLIEYSSVFDGRSSIDDTIAAKNLFKRPKLRDDFSNIATGFTLYEIKEGERPDQIAERFYKNSSLDWVVLITNNITNLNEQWPLDNNSFHKYLLDKYGSDEKLYEVHHYETVEYKDDFNRILIEGGLEVDPPKSEVVTTNTTTNSYLLDSFPSAKSNTIISINLNQRLTVSGRDIKTSTYDISDILAGTSNLKVKSRGASNPEDYTDITVVNSLTNWPNGWGGILRVGTRSGENVEVTITDVILDTKVRLSERLYEITGTLNAEGVLIPTFNFTNEIPA